MPWHCKPLLLRSGRRGAVEFAEQVFRYRGLRRERPARAAVHAARRLPGSVAREAARLPARGGLDGGRLATPARPLRRAAEPDRLRLAGPRPLVRDRGAAVDRSLRRLHDRPARPVGDSERRLRRHVDGRARRARPRAARARSRGSARAAIDRRAHRAVSRVGRDLAQGHDGSRVPALHPDGLRRRRTVRADARRLGHAGADRSAGAVLRFAGRRQGRLSCAARRHPQARNRDLRVEGFHRRSRPRRRPGRRHRRRRAHRDRRRRPLSLPREARRAARRHRCVPGAAAMSLRGKTAVVGVYEHPARYAPHLTQYQIMAESARGALADAGFTLADVDGLCTAGVGPIGVIALANHLNLRPTYLDSTNLGGSSFVAHVAHASAAIAAGLCNVALILYGSTAASERFAVGTGGTGAFGDPPDAYEAPYGPTVVGNYAMAAMRHMHEYGTTSQQLAEIAVTTRRHASLNPAGKYHDLITVEDVLASRVVSSPLHLLDCCMISDGGGALVVTSAERARDAKKKAATVLGAAEAVRHTGIGHEDVLEVAAAQSG